MQSRPSLQPSPMTAPGCKRRSVADDGAVAHVRERVDRHVDADLGRGCNTGLGMNTGPARLMFADQMRANGQKGGHRVVDLDDGQALFSRHLGRN